MDFANNMVVGIGNALSHIFLIMFTAMFMYRGSWLSPQSRCD